MKRAFGLLVVAACAGCYGSQEPPGAPDPPTAQAAEAAPTDEELAADAVLRFVLTDERLADLRDFYGTPGSTDLYLSAKVAGWPAGDLPALAGYVVHRGDTKTHRGPGRPRMLGVWVSRFDLTARPDPEGEWRMAREDAGVILTLVNAGGSKDGVVGGSCRVFLNLRRGQAGWEVVFKGLRST